MSETADPAAPGDEPCPAKADSSEAQIFAHCRVKRVFEDYFECQATRGVLCQYALHYEAASLCRHPQVHQILARRPRD